MILEYFRQARTGAHKPRHTSTLAHDACKIPQSRLRVHEGLNAFPSWTLLRRKISGKLQSSMQWQVNETYQYSSVAQATGPPSVITPGQGGDWAVAERGRGPRG